VKSIFFLRALPKAGPFSIKQN